MHTAIKAEEVEICMLLKDEELLIEPVIRELKKYFSRFCIIDQGSNDRTIEIVSDLIGREANISRKPRNYILQTGFARARNELTSMCRLPWVFHVDADEQIVSGIDAGIVETDAGNNASRVFTVERRNLGRPANVPTSLPPEETSLFPVMSVENIPRLYLREQSVLWKSFIHEELVDSETLHGCESRKSKIVLNHISQLKSDSSKEYKEELYGWMIMMGASETGFMEDKLSGYSEAVIIEQGEYFKEMARRFSLRVQECL